MQNNPLLFPYTLIQVVYSGFHYSRKRGGTLRITGDRFLEQALGVVKPKSFRQNGVLDLMGQYQGGTWKRSNGGESGDSHRISTTYTWSFPSFVFLGILTAAQSKF